MSVMTHLHVCGMMRPRGCALPRAALRARIEAAAASPGCAGLPGHQPTVRPGAQAAVQAANERAANIAHPLSEGQTAFATSARRHCSPAQGTLLHCLLSVLQHRHLGEWEL